MPLAALVVVGTPDLDYTNQIVNKITDWFMNLSLSRYFIIEDTIIQFHSKNCYNNNAFYILDLVIIY